MFAVIKTGGLQYSVAEDQVVRIGRIEGEPGQIVQIGTVLMLGGDKPELGAPMVSGASVAVEILDQSRGPKVIAFKKRRRKNSRRKRGHRQDYTDGADLGDPDRRRQAHQGSEAEAGTQGSSGQAG